MRLKNKVALITGAADGIGKATAQLFAEEGAVVVLTDIKAEEIKRNTAGLHQQGHSAVAIEQDVSLEEEWIKVINHIVENYGRLDVLVNNAGIGGIEGVEEASLEQWEKVQSTNLRSIFLGMKYAVGVMKKQNKGSIINTSSIFGMIGTGGAASYHASKSAITGLTKTSAVEFAKYSIRVNAIHPGVIKTNMTKKKINDEKMRDDLTAKTPLPYFGEPEDVAYCSLYLASDESRFVTGSSLVVDGGYTSY